MVPSLWSIGLLIFHPMDSQKAPDTIAWWTRFPVSINASPKIFCCFILKHANDVFLFRILKLFTLFCNPCTLFIGWFFPDFMFSLWTTLILEEMDCSSFVSSASKSSGFQLFSLITFQNILSTSSSSIWDLCSFLVLFGSRQQTSSSWSCPPQ